MSFAQWYAMPTAERKHRRMIYLADVERQIEQRDKSAPWVEGSEE